MGTQPYEKLVKRNASFFGGASLVDPMSAKKIVKRSKKFALGSAGDPIPKKSRKRKGK